MAYASINPFNNELLKTFPDATDAEVNAALDKAHEAFLSWRNSSFAERAAVLRRAAALVRERTEELARLNTLEMGKLLWEARWENETVAQIFEYYAENGERLLAPRKLENVPHDPADVVMVYEPQGIVFEIEPWNVPMFQAVRPLAPQIMAGNAVILKHASIVPQCSAAIEKLMLDAGLPEGVFINLYATHAQSERIRSDARVVGLTLTGSEAVGSKVASLAGKYIKKSVMELGGSDPMLVLDDADIEAAVKGAMLGRLTVSGQVCVGDKRMIVADKVYEAFLAGLSAAIDALQPGDPMDPTTTLGPVSSQSAADGVNAQIREAVANGATATELGKPIPNQGAFVQPTILTGLTPDNPIYYQEVFGPVVLLFRAKDEAEAIRLANDSPYGLGASIYSTNIDRAVAVARQIEVGAVTINQPTSPTPATPFGGIKNSGYGRELGPEGIREFTNQKVILGQKVAGAF